MRSLPLVVLALSLAFTGCKKAELDSLEATVLVVELSAASIDADDGSITARAQALDGGVIVLDGPIELSVTGASSAAAQIVEIDGESGEAVATFTGLDTAGASSVTAVRGTLQSSAAFDVEPGAPVALALTLSADTDADAGVIDATTAVTDAHGNAIADAPVLLSTDAPGAVIVGGSITNLSVAGSWTAFASVEGAIAASDSAGFDVAPGQAAAVHASLATPTAEAGGSATVTCIEADAFGNARPRDWAAGEVTISPAIAGAVITENDADSSDGVDFDLTVLAAKGLFSIQCDNGTLDDVATLAIADTVAPLVTELSIVSGAPDNTAPYDAGTILTVRLAATDPVGVSGLSLSILSGPAEIISAAAVQTTGASASFDFTVRVNGNTTGASTIALRGQASDTTGNVAIAGSLSADANAASVLVTATLSQPQTEAGRSFTITCDELHAVTGASTGRTFTNAQVFSQHGSVNSSGTNTWTIATLLNLGTYFASCTNGTLTTQAFFSVFDVTAPNVTAFGPTSSTPDNTSPYDAGTEVTVTLTATDFIGVGGLAISLVSGNAEITSAASVPFTGTTNPASFPFKVKVYGSTSGPSNVVLRAQASDIAGNVRASGFGPDVTLAVNTAPVDVEIDLSATTVEASAPGGLAFTCHEVNAASRAPTSLTFTAGPGAGARATSTSGVVSGGPGNTFAAGSFTAKGSATATCDNGAGASASAGFTVFDATPPTVSAIQVDSSTGPNGVTPDSAYAAGTEIVVYVDLADQVDLGRVELVSDSIYASVADSPQFYAAGTSSGTAFFTVTIAPDAPTLLDITLDAQATDSTGNSAGSSLQLSIDPGAGLASNATIRTVYEASSVLETASGMGTDGTDLFVQQYDQGTGDVTAVLRLDVSGAIAASSVHIGSGFPVPGLAAGGVTALAAPFGGKQIFHTVLATQPVVGVEAGAAAPFSHASFDPTPSDLVLPTDVTFGDLSLGSRLFTIDPGLATTLIFGADADGESVLYLLDTSGELATSGSIAADPAAPRMLIPDTDGEIHEIVDDGFGAGVRSTVVLTGGPLPPNDARDIAIGASGDILIAGGSSGAVYHLDGATVLTPLSSAFDFPFGVAITSDGDAYVLDDVSGDGVWRVYRVTGF